MTFSWSSPPLRHAMTYSISEVTAAKAQIAAEVPGVAFFETNRGLGLRAHRGDRSCIVFQPAVEGCQSEIVEPAERVISFLMEGVAR